MAQRGSRWAPPAPSLRVLAIWRHLGLQPASGTAAAPLCPPDTQKLPSTEQGHAAAPANYLIKHREREQRHRKQMGLVMAGEVNLFVY